MLKKLMKHEWKATYRLFLPVYIGLAVLTGAAYLVLSLTEHLGDDSLWYLGAGFGMIFGIFGIIFVFLSPFIFLSMRFYKTTATREAYLTFTIPAKTHVILAAKFIVSFLWTLVTIVLAWLAVSLVIHKGGGTDYVDVVLSLFSEESWSFALLDIVSWIFSLANTLFAIFTAICLGQLVRDHRVIASIAFYAAIYTVQQIVNFIALLPNLAVVFRDSSYSASDTIILVVSLIINLVFLAAEYLLSNYLLNKKLNLL